MSTFHWLLVVFAAVGSGITALFYKFYMPKQVPEDLPIQSPPPPAPIRVPIQPLPYTAADRVYKAAVMNRGKKLTLDPSVPPEVGCCEALSVILKDAQYGMPLRGIPGVNAFIEWMVAKGFPEIALAEAKPGDIITAHSPVLTNPEGAHIGVLMKYGICSNDSRPEYLGLWIENYPSIKAWILGFPKSTVRVFRPC